MICRLFTFIILSSLLVHSCRSSVGSEVVPVEEIEETINELEYIYNDNEQDTIKKQHEIKEFKENLRVIEKKYGEQWDFCPCVVVSDSIDKAVKRLVDFESPAAEKLFERFEYVSLKCQAFIGMDANRTPDQRAIHEKKVKNCLKNQKSI